MVTRGISLCCGMWRLSACEMWGEDAVWMGDVTDVSRWHRGPKRELWSRRMIAKQTQIKDSGVLQFPVRKFDCFMNIFQKKKKAFSVIGNT